MCCQNTDLHKPLGGRECGLPESIIVIEISICHLMNKDT